MSAPINLRSEAIKRAAESEAERTRDAINASAIRGLLIGLPLSMALWAGPILVAGLSRNWWLGALAGALEVGAVSLWARLARKEQ